MPASTKCIRRNHRTSGFKTSPHQIHTQQGRAGQAPPPSDSRTQSRLPGEIQLFPTAWRWPTWPIIYIKDCQGSLCKEKLNDLATTCPRFMHQPFLYHHLHLEDQGTEVPLIPAVELVSEPKNPAIPCSNDAGAMPQKHENINWWQTAPSQKVCESKKNTMTKIETYICNEIVMIYIYIYTS